MGDESRVAEHSVPVSVDPTMLLDRLNPSRDTRISLFLAMLEGLSDTRRISPRLTYHLIASREAALRLRYHLRANCSPRIGSATW